MDFARSTAAKIARDLPIDVEDAIQIGYEGLIQAAQRFDISKHDPTIGDLDTNFKSFAYPRIRGAVIDKSRSDTFVKRRGLEKGISFQFTSIDERWDSGDGSDSDVPVIQIEAIAMDEDMKIDFERALKTLNDRERHVVMSLAVGAKGHELAEELSVSESRVSQLASEARRKLTVAMTG